MSENELKTHYVDIGRWRAFPSLSVARAYCERVFKSTGVVLTIVDSKPKRGRAHA